MTHNCHSGLRKGVVGIVFGSRFVRFCIPLEAIHTYIYINIYIYIDMGIPQNIEVL